MTLTPLYDRWIEHIARQEHVALTLVGCALLVVLFIVYVRQGLKLVAAGFWATLFGLVMCNPPAIRWPTFGMLLGQSLWYDECFTWAVARLPAGRMMQAIAGDVHPPLWYIIEWGTIRLLGTSEVALRLPALLFGLLGLWLTYRLAVALGYSRKIAALAALLLAMMPAWRYYAQEARMYTLLACGVLVASLGLAIRRNWLMALGMVVTLYTQNLGVFYVAVTIGLSLWRGDKTDHRMGRIGRELIATLTPLAVAGVVWLPWLAILARQVRHVEAGFWVPDYSLGGYVMGLYRIMFGIGAPEFLEVHAMLAVIGLLALVVWEVRRDPVKGIIPLTLALVPMVLLALVAETWRPVYLERTLLPSIPFLMILVVSGLDRLTGEYRRPILAVLVPLLFVCLVWQSKGAAGVYKLADDIATQYRPGDVIYHANLASYITLSYYLPETRGYRHIAWPDAGDLSQALTVETQEAMGIYRANAQDVWSNTDRLLVVWVENPTTTEEEAQAMREALTLGQSRQLAEWQNSNLVTMELWEVRHDVHPTNS